MGFQGESSFKMQREEKNILFIGAGSRLAGGVLIGLLMLLAVSTLLKMRSEALSKAI